MDSMQIEYIERILSQRPQKEEYERLVREHQNLYMDWQEHINLMTRERDLTPKLIAQGCEVSETNARSFLKKIPAKRENVIMLAMMMRLTVDQTNDLLMRWAKFQKLYSRNPNDAIWIYLLEKGGSDHPRSLFRMYKTAYEQIRDEQNPHIMHEYDMPANTQYFFEQIVDQAQQSEGGYHDEVDANFRNLMKNGMNSFEKGYQKLLSYIDSFFYDLEIQDNRRLRMESSDEEREFHVPSRVRQGDKDWKKAYYRKIRALEKKQAMPCRAFLIVLGLRLGMNTDQLNTLLNLAGMGPLCPKDKLDGTVVLYLEEISCNYPNYSSKPANISVSIEYDLMDYSARMERARRKRNIEGETPFMANDIARGFEENSAECLNDYIKRSIEGTDSFEFGYEDYIMELAEQLGP